MPATTDRLAQAIAYREELGKQGIRFGRADGMVKAKFPDVDINAVREKKHGGFSKVAGAVGDVVKFAAPVAALIPGVGPLAAAGIGAAGGALGELNDRDHSFTGGIKDALAGGAWGYAGATGLEKLGLGAPSTGGYDPVPQGGAWDGAAGTFTNAGGKKPGGGFLSGVNQFLGSNTFDNLLQLGGLGAGVYGATQQGKAQDQEFDENKRRYDQQVAQRSQAGQTVAPYLKGIMDSLEQDRLRARRG